MKALPSLRRGRVCSDIHVSAGTSRLLRQASQCQTLDLGSRPEQGARTGSVTLPRSDRDRDLDRDFPIGRTMCYPQQVEGSQEPHEA